MSGKLDTDAVLPGKIAWFNMWDYEMSEQEVKALGCRDKGNVSSWDTLAQQGTGSFHYETFLCNGKCTYI